MRWLRSSLHSYIVVTSLHNCSLLNEIQLRTINDNKLILPYKLHLENRVNFFSKSKIIN